MFRSVAILSAAALCGMALVWAAPNPVAPPIVAAAKGAASFGEDKIWTGVVIATNSSSPKEPPPELREFSPRLKRVFGYNQFELFGSASNPIGDQAEKWLVPSQNFWLGVKARRATSKEARGGYLLNLQLFQNKRPLVDTEAKLAPGSPLFIRGPAYGKGHVIIVLQVERAAPVVAGQ